MRLDRLELIRYGKFTDTVVDFGPVPAGPDLHMVYGPNEAGKSTLFAAWRDLLFGMEARTRFAFQHDHAALRVGATLTIGGAERRFFRAKAGLRDGLDQVVADSAILAELGGIDRDAFTTMFSLDDGSLYKGGEEILRARGELGQLLFAGASGLTELTARLEEMEARANEFYRRGGRGGTLNDLVRQAKDLADERKQLEIRADVYHQLNREREQAQARFQAAAARLGEMAARAERIARQERARPRLAEWRDLAAALAELGAWPAAPADWAAELPRLRDEQAQAAAQRQAHDQQVSALRDTIAALVDDPAAVAAAAACADLGARLAAWAARAAERPALERTRDQVAAQLATLCTQWGQPAAQPEALLIAERRRAALRDLATGWIGRDAARAAAANELANACAELERLPEPMAEPAALERATRLRLLTQALGQWREHVPQGRAQAASERLEEARGAYNAALDRLAPWRASVGELAAMVAPSAAALDTVEREIAAARAQVADLAAQAERLQAEERGLWARIDAAIAVPGLVDEAELAPARVGRDAAWTRHRARMDGDSADQFERALRQDDELNARLIRQLDQLAQLRGDRLALARIKGEVAQVLASATAAARRRAEAEAALAGLRAGLDACLPAEWDVARLRLWLDEREAALAAHRAVRAAKNALAAAAADNEARAAALADALAPLLPAPLPEPASPAWAVATAEALLEREAEWRGRADAVKAATRRRDDARRADADARAALAAWHGEWRQAAAGTWLEHGADPSALVGVLDQLAALAPALERGGEAAARLVWLDDEEAALGTAIAALEARLDMDTPGDSPAERLDHIARRVDQARHVARRLAEETARLDAAGAAGRALAAREAELAARAGVITGHFAVATLAQAQVALDALARRAELEQRMAGLAHAVVADLDCADLAAAQAELAGIDWDQLAGERAALVQDLAVAEEERLAALRALTRAEDAVAAVGGDAAAARADEQRRTVLAELAEGVREAYGLRAGLAATRAALKLYRERHRSALMAKASDAFASMTGGKYRGLATQTDKKGEVLVALEASGASKLPDALSKGTIFQLYLALRIAGYLDFVANRPPVPFVVDDTLESFDDDRSAETFRLLGAMAAHGQVIYLTHHRHLCDIAARMCPGIKIHQLVY